MAPPWVYASIAYHEITIIIEEYVGAACLGVRRARVCGLSRARLWARNRIAAVPADGDGDGDGDENSMRLLAWLEFCSFRQLPIYFCGARYMDPRAHFIMAKQRILTSTVRSLEKVPVSERPPKQRHRSQQGNWASEARPGLYGKQGPQGPQAGRWLWRLTFENGKSYNYRQEDIVWLQNPKVYEPPEFCLEINGQIVDKLEAVYLFQASPGYAHVRFTNRRAIDVPEAQIRIAHSIANQPVPARVLAYLGELAGLEALKTESGQSLLSMQYNRLSFIEEDSVFQAFAQPKTYTQEKKVALHAIFPFGLNASQYQAVRLALANRVSIIQGPPGTGKTQTILNILANIVLRGESALVVSSNNSAIENVLEKLKHPDLPLDFLVAVLGKSDNMRKFDMEQPPYPMELFGWYSLLNNSVSELERLAKLSQDLGQVYAKQVELAQLELALSELRVEFRHFEAGGAGNAAEAAGSTISTRFASKLSAKYCLKLWKTVEHSLSRNGKLSIWQKLLFRFRFGIRPWAELNNPALLLQNLRSGVYIHSIREMEGRIEALGRELSAKSTSARIAELRDLSQKLLKTTLFTRYAKHRENDSPENLRVKVSSATWRDNPNAALAEYPIVLSTTHSSRNGLGEGMLFDYVIMDEASQVNLATGALALTNARRAVIVGDANQLSAVIPNALLPKYKQAFLDSTLPDAYDAAQQNFLTAMQAILPQAPETLLREHYRCHPKIANFVNKQFYDGKLVIMTKDRGEEDVISVLQTVEGNHRRGNQNKRQTQMLLQELLPRLGERHEDIGIIAPYREQVRALSAIPQLASMEIDTVHKFQGREKDSIIICTVSDTADSFSDGPELMNVAISRAKNKLHLLTSSNEQPANSNTAALIHYIEYNNFSVTKSKTRSIFDLLYSQYTADRQEFLKLQRRVSRFDSENLMFGLLADILKNPSYSSLSLVCHYPLHLLIADSSLLNAELAAYALHPATHLDFLIYRKVGKDPALAIEVDGIAYHRAGTKQAERDKRKNEVLDIYKVPLLRFATDGSGEAALLEQTLAGIMSSASGTTPKQLPQT